MTTITGHADQFIYAGLSYIKCCLKSYQYACFIVIVTPSPSSMMSNTATKTTISSATGTYIEPTGSTMMPTSNGTSNGTVAHNKDETSMIILYSVHIRMLVC